MDEDSDQPLLMPSLIIGVVLAGILISFMYVLTHNKSYQNEAIERGDGIVLNDIRYSPDSLTDYTVTNVLICKTDSGAKIYQIKEYPDYEYVFVSWGREADIYKREEDAGQ